MQGTSTSAPFPMLPRRAVMQVSYTAVSDFLRGALLSPDYPSKSKGEDQVRTKFGNKYWSQHKNKTRHQKHKESYQTEEHSQKVIEPEVWKPKSPYYKISQVWNKVRYGSITQRRQEPRLKTKQTRMKSKRVRSKTTAKWHCRLPRATGGVAWHICY